MAKEHDRQIRTVTDNRVRKLLINSETDEEKQCLKAHAR